MSDSATMASSCSEPHSVPPSLKNGLLTPAITAIKLISGESFSAHTDLLTYWSPKMRKMLEDDAKQLRLDDNPDVIRNFLNWIYTGVLPCMEIHNSIDNETHEIIGEGEDAELLFPERYYRQQEESQPLDLYIFATNFDIRKLRNEAFDATYSALEGVKSIPSYISILTAYDGLPSDSPMLRYMVDAYAVTFVEDCNTDEEKTLRKKVPSKFLMDVLLKKCEKGFMRRRAWNACDYHEHVGDEKKTCHSSSEKDFLKKKSTGGG